MENTSLHAPQGQKEKNKTKTKTWAAARHLHVPPIGVKGFQLLDFCLIVAFIASESLGQQELREHVCSRVREGNERESKSGCSPCGSNVSLRDRLHVLRARVMFNCLIQLLMMTDGHLGLSRTGLRVSLSVSLVVDPLTVPM